MLQSKTRGSDNLWNKFISYEALERYLEEKKCEMKMTMIDVDVKVASLDY